MLTTIYKLECTSCGSEFYELEDETLDDCPGCHIPLVDMEPRTISEDNVEVYIEPITGEIKIK